MKNPRLSYAVLRIGAIAALGALAACQAGTKGSGNTGGSGKSAALRTMEQVAIAAHKCWFASKDPAFRPYGFANELNSFSGRPRFLLVPARRHEARPLLVVQAEGSPARLEAFGPLMQEPLSARISADLNRWSSGDQSCASPA